MSDSATCFSTSVLNDRFLPRHFFDHLVETWLVDGECITVPGIDSSGGYVHDSYLNVGTFQGNDGHGRTADVSSSDATNFHHFGQN